MRSISKASLTVLVVVAVLGTVLASSSEQPLAAATGRFGDDDGSIHESDIEAIAAAGITLGCSADGQSFCPNDAVTRGQMASFLARGLGLSSGGASRFGDDNGSVHESDIEAIAAAGITFGCSADGQSFCPNDAVTRGQMASFLARSLDLAVSVGSETVLTGDVEGAYIGRVVLEGTVNFVGHVTIANGGVLVARPGVRVEGNGYELLLTNGARADIQGTPTSTWSDQGRVQNLDRDVVFNNLSRIMFHMGAGPSTLKYFTVSNSGASETGHYPLHWHLNGDTTRGTIVEGVVVLNGRHHAFVPHGSHGITFKETIAKNTAGDPYWWDDPGSNEQCDFQKFCTLDNSNDIVYDHALADGVTNGPNDDRGFRLSGFSLVAGSGNVVRDSAAININASHVKDCSGFSWSEGSNQNVGGNVWLFENNYSFSPSGCHGIFVWQNDNNTHVIEGFSGGGIDHGAYDNEYVYRNVDVPYTEIHSVGWFMEDSHAGDLIARDHVSSGTVTFNNVTFDSFTVADGAKEPATYLLNGTNISCGDIVYESVAPGSIVVIDGQEC
jgi:hypothetical protein